MARAHEDLADEEGVDAAALHRTSSTEVKKQIR
jgi:hypothetical protein